MTSIQIGEYMDMLTAAILISSIVAMFIINRKIGAENSVEDYFARLAFVYIAPVGIALILIGLVQKIKNILI